eukprot:sb/3470262/
MQNTTSSLHKTFHKILIAFHSLSIDYAIILPVKVVSKTCDSVNFTTLTSNYCLAPRHHLSSLSLKWGMAPPYRAITDLINSQHHSQDPDGDGSLCINDDMMLPYPDTKDNPPLSARSEIALRDPAIEDDTLEMTYTFNSLFGDVQRHVIPTGSDPLDSPVDPLASAAKAPTTPSSGRSLRRAISVSRSISTTDINLLDTSGSPVDFRDP